MIFNKISCSLPLALHETPLIANTIARMKLYEMNSGISDTAEYGCYLYDQQCRPLLTPSWGKKEKRSARSTSRSATVGTDVIGTKYSAGRDNGVDNRLLNAINEEIRSHPVEEPRVCTTTPHR
ncbi:hypothetical protein EMIHUDRAFT_252372 [Emiliania huxleyi CCMP1516]|uniref:Acetohydroxy-acid reductoisomerase n=2 Tax=Emiliania huxleyi TaxID=2903 RepID=A0A0D3KKR0_EMIH1|nr:hypothetical protein EMIHUDRAFT_252372 [Emiliania huxleyi CCMP1516]EOD36345.1 hypothetical protein EMIHUDRAFT_252372 [Emiliania huxleyi CCMP1516]|eukprot:XP_005788774.1 hypothetical protein EMIHUDRAFT_252372 [Emiliania huxleyi CCMP1516]